MMPYSQDFMEYLGGLETKTHPSTKEEINATAVAAQKKAGVKQKPSGKRKIGRVLLIAAAVAAGAIVTAAAAGVNVGDLFRGCFTELNPVNNRSEAVSLTQGQFEALNKTGAVVNQSVTSNGTVVTIKATAGDDHHALFLMEIEAPKGKILSDGHFSDSHFGGFSLSLPGTENSQKGWSVSGGAIPRKCSNSKIAYLWEIECPSFNLQGQEVKLAVKDMTDYRGMVTAAGDWAFDFKLNLGDSKTKEIKMGKTIRYQIAPKTGKNTAMQCTAETLKLSALSVFVNYSGQNLCTESRKQVPDWLIIHRRNEKDLFLLSVNGDGNSKKLTVSYPSSEPLDLDNIISVTIGDVTVPVS